MICNRRWQPKKESLKKAFPLHFHLVFEMDLPDNSFLVDGKEHNVDTDAAWDAAKKNDYSYIESYISDNKPSKQIIELLKYTDNQKLTEIITGI